MQTLSEVRWPHIGPDLTSLEGEQGRLIGQRHTGLVSTLSAWRITKTLSRSKEWWKIAWSQISPLSLAIARSAVDYSVSSMEMASRQVWAYKNAARREPREVARAVLTAVKDRAEDVCTYPGNLWQSLVRYQYDR
jgi:hypothetical protein